jgi:hypothetical protein
MLNPLPVNPAKITFKFPTRTCGFDPSNLAPPVYSLSQSTTLPGVNIGSLEFTEDALALFTPATSTTTPTNNSALQTLIQQFSTDFLNWRQTQFDIVLAGIANVAQNGLIQVTEFDYNSDMCRTRITSLPDNFPPDRLAHQLITLSTDCPNTTDSNTAEPCFKGYGPPSTSESGSTTFDEFLLCFQDGRLTEKFLQQVTYPCGCGPSGCMINIGVFNCNTAKFIPGAFVQVTGNGVNLSGVTGSNGEITFTIPESGIYTVFGSALGTQNFRQAVLLVCGLGTTIWLQESVNSCFQFTAVGCGGGGTQIPGATLAIAGTTYDLPATVCLSVPGNSPPPTTVFPYTVSAPPTYADATGSVTITGNCFAQGGPIAVSLMPAPGFVCFCGGGNCAIPATVLDLTDSAYGPVTLAFGIVAGQQQWQGTLTVNYPGGIFFGGGITCLPQNSVTITYTLFCTQPGAIPTLEIDYQQTIDQVGCPTFDGDPNSRKGSCILVLLTSSSVCPVDLSFTIPAPGAPPEDGQICFLYPDGSTFTVTQP